jgi:protein TonB
LLTYGTALLLAAALHLGLFLATGGLFHTPADGASEPEEPILEKNLTLTFSRPEPVELKSKQAVPVTRVREPLPPPAPVQSPIPEQKTPPEPVPVVESGPEQPAEAETEPNQPTERLARSTLNPEQALDRSRALPASRITKPRPLRPIDVEAVYPLGARLRGEEGAVRLSARIGEDGRVDVVEIHASSGFAILDRAAERAVRRTRFSPATRNDRPVAGDITITIRFHLDS